MAYVRRRNCGGDCACAPCQAKANPRGTRGTVKAETGRARERREEEARVVASLFRPGGTRSTARLATLKNGDGEGFTRAYSDLCHANRAGHIVAADRYDDEAKRNPGGPAAQAQLAHWGAARRWEECTAYVPGGMTAKAQRAAVRKAEAASKRTLEADAAWAAHRAAIDRIKARHARLTNPAGVGYGVAALIGAAGFVAGAYAESSLGLTQQFKGRKAAPAPAPRVLTTDPEWVSQDGKKPNQREYSRMIRGFMYYILTEKNLAGRRGTIAYLDRGDGTRIKGPDGGDTFNTLAAAKKAAEADAAKRQNPTAMAFRNRAIQNHHIRIGGTFYTPGGRRGTVLSESPGYYRVRWSDGTVGSVQDSEMTAYPTEGSRVTARTNGKRADADLLKGVLVDLARLARDEKEASKSRARRSYSPHTKEALARAAMLDMDAPRHRNPAHSRFSRPLLNFESQGTFEGGTAWWINAGEGDHIGELSRQRPFGSSGLKQFSRQASLPYEWLADIDGTHLTIPDGSTLTEAKNIVRAAYARKNPRARKNPACAIGDHVTLADGRRGMVTAFRNGGMADVDVGRGIVVRQPTSTLKPIHTLLHTRGSK